MNKKPGRKPKAQGVVELPKKYTRDTDEAQLMATLLVPAFEQMIVTGTLNGPEVERVIGLAELTVNAIKEGKIETTK